MIPVDSGLWARAGLLRYADPMARHRAWLLGASLYNLVWGSIAVLAPNLFFDAAGMSVRQSFATSDDGTAVPYFVVGRRLDGPAPTLMTALIQAGRARA